MKLSTAFIIFALPLSISAKYPFLNQMPEGSKLRTECNSCEKGLIFTTDIQKACDELEGKAKKYYEKGLDRISNGNWGWLDVINAQQHKRKNIRIILAAYDDEIKFEEDRNYSDLLDKLDSEYYRRKEEEKKREEANKSKPKY